MTWAELTSYHPHVRPLDECYYTGDEIANIAAMQCWRSAEDAEKAATALLLTFERLDALSASYALVGDGGDDDGPVAA